MVEYGRRSQRFLDQALAKAPNDPLVLLVEGQALLFKPSVFGGDAAKALDRFRRLETVLRRSFRPEMLPVEAQIWQYQALKKMDAVAAQRLKARIKAENPLPLFASMLGS